MSIPEIPTTRVLREKHLQQLPASVREIAETITRLSKSTWRSTWANGAEHRVWRAIHHAGGDRSRLGLDPGACADMRRLADAASGWVTWTSHPVFVPFAAWVAVHRTWSEQHPEPAAPAPGSGERRVDGRPKEGERPKRLDRKPRNP